MSHSQYSFLFYSFLFHSSHVGDDFRSLWLLTCMRCSASAFRVWGQLHVLLCICVCTSTGSHVCIRLTQRDHLDSDRSTYGARCAHSCVWARQVDLTNCCSTAWRTHTHCRQIQASIQHAWMPAIRLSITASSPPPLHSLRCSRRMCAQGPPTVSYWAQGWQDGDYGGGGSWSAESHSLWEGGCELPGLCSHHR